MNRLFRQISDGQKTVWLSIVPANNHSRTDFDLAISFEAASGKLTVNKRIVSELPTDVAQIYASLSEEKILDLAKQVIKRTNIGQSCFIGIRTLNRYTDRMQFASNPTQTA